MSDSSSRPASTGPDVRAEVVTAIMQRVGAAMPPGRFVYEVARAYGSVAPTKGGERLELRHSDPAFQESIRRSGAAGSVLVLGCGEGLCGFDPAYARREYQGIWPSTAVVEECVVTPPLLWDRSQWPQAQFDAVVCYLMVHYIYDLELFFEMVRRTVAPGGCFVMAGHNASFWRTPELRQAADNARTAVRSQARWRKYLRLGTWLGRARRLLKPAQAPDIGTRVNTALASRVPLTSQLTFPEIAHLIDVHRPPAQPSALQVGLTGFDVQHLTQKYLNGFHLEFYRSRGWSGYLAAEQLSDELRAREVELGQRYPDDGVFFSACWRRSA